MKTIINGKQVEGTPSELLEYEKLQKGEKPLFRELPNPQWPYPSPYEMQADWLVRYPHLNNPYVPTKTTTGDAQWMEYRPKLMSELEYLAWISTPKATFTTDC